MVKPKHIHSLYLALQNELRCLLVLLLRKSVSDNDKFTMRLFLVSLDFKGEEYKFARKFLLKNLSGNSSWRTEDAKARHDARKVQQEIEAPEATIEHSSEGGEGYAELSE